MAGATEGTDVTGATAHTLTGGYRSPAMAGEGPATTHEVEAGFGEVARAKESMVQLSIWAVSSTWRHRRLASRLSR